MESVIKKAIEGGWTPIKRGLKPKKGAMGQTYIKALIISQGVEWIVLDSYFWMALHKACDWPQSWTFRPMKNIKEDRGAGKVTAGNWWEHYALKFHEINLTEGWDAAVLYLTNLTGN